MDGQSAPGELGTCLVLKSPTRFAVCYKELNKNSVTILYYEPLTSC